jgi:hypothetical protein
VAIHPTFITLILLLVIQSQSLASSLVSLDDATAVTSSTSLTSTESYGGAEAVSPLYEPTASVNSSPDWNGLWRDTGLLLGGQFIASGLLYMMPQSASGWTSEQKKNVIQHYGDNFVRPVFDKDPFYSNYILHPYWGATYYIRGRERGLDKASSFVYSVLMSAMFEFGAECFFEKPSIQDLITTPVAGSLLGALIFEPWRDLIKRKQKLDWYDHAALIVTDPLNILSVGVEKMLGIKSTTMVDYSVPRLQKSSTGSASKSSRIGFAMQFHLN